MNKSLENISDEEIRYRISKLEQELIVEIPGLGKVPIYDPKFDATVDWIIAKWKNPCNSDEEEINELFLIDENGEFNYSTYKGARVVSSKDERENLHVNFAKRFKQRRPLYVIAFNGAYDNTQTRMALNEMGEIFDPLTFGMQPRRDQVIQFLQRMKQDNIHIDLLWITRLFAPFLGQRSLDSNFKLQSASRWWGYDFTKKLNHDQLRTHDAIRIAHPDSEKRKESLEMMADYTGSDVGPLTVAMQDEIRDFYCKLKMALPYCTTTQLGFSAACMEWVHDYHHMLRNGNIRFSGYATKEREDELSIFTKRFNDLQKKKLNSAGIEIVKGQGKDVSEIYLPLEEGISPVLFKIAPELETVYNETKDNPRQHFAFLQYLRAFSRDVLADYYFAKKEELEFKKVKKENYVSQQQYLIDWTIQQRTIDSEQRNSFLARFNSLKNIYRSVYVSLPGKARAIIRPTTTHFREFETIPGFEDEQDLYLLYQRAEEVKLLIPAQKRSNLNRFTTTFKAFYEQWNLLEKLLAGKVNNPRMLTYAQMRESRAERYRRVFSARYCSDVEELSDLINKFYSRVAENIRKVNGIVLDMKGNYLFVESDVPVEGTYEVRRLPYYNSKQNKPLEKRENEQMELSYLVQGNNF